MGRWVCGEIKIGACASGLFYDPFMYLFIHTAIFLPVPHFTLSNLSLTSSPLRGLAVGKAPIRCGASRLHPGAGEQRGSVRLLHGEWWAA